MLFSTIISWGLYQAGILPMWTPIVLTCLTPVCMFLKRIADEVKEEKRKRGEKSE